MRLLGWKALNCFEEFFFKKVALGGSLLDFDEGFKVSTCPTLELTSMNSWHLLYIVIAS
jgi:hypothetical protein